jgi:hypothetical protein
MPDGEVAAACFRDRKGGERRVAEIPVENADRLPADHVGRPGDRERGGSHHSPTASSLSSPPRSPGEDGLILPLPATLKGGAVAKVCSALLAKGLAEEVALSRKRRPRPRRCSAPPRTTSRSRCASPLWRQALNGEAAEEAPFERAKAPPKKKAVRRTEKANAPQAAASAAQEKKAAHARKDETARTSRAPARSSPTSSSA